MTTVARKTADQRRAEILAAARAEFARDGLHGASTDAIARGAGVSQPYLFRLFGTKKRLFLELVRLCFDQTFDTFLRAASGKDGEEALLAMGAAYFDLIASDPDLLRAQMQAYAACDDPDVRTAVRAGYRRLVELVERVSGAPPDRVSGFFARGMLFNVVVSMGLREQPEAWGDRLVEGCMR